VLESNCMSFELRILQKLQQSDCDSDSDRGGDGDGDRQWAMGIEYTEKCVWGPMCQAIPLVTLAKSGRKVSKSRSKPPGYVLPIYFYV